MTTRCCIEQLAMIPTAYTLDTY